jgi:hypothetical protein
MATLIYTIIEAPNRGWSAGLSIAGFVAAAVLLAGGGNSAGQAAMFLSRESPGCRLLIRGGDLWKSMSRYLVDQSERSLRKEGRIWMLWNAGVIVTFSVPAALLVWIQPLAFPVAAIFLGHEIAVLHLQARRGARGVKPIADARDGPERVALGLLRDLVDHQERALLAKPAWPFSGGSSAPGWSGRRTRSWSGREEAGSTASACGSARPTTCRLATGSLSCFSPCARTRRDSPRWRTGTSRARPGACGWSCRSESAPPLSGRAADLLGEDSQAVHQLSALRR